MVPESEADRPGSVPRQRAKSPEGKRTRGPIVPETPVPTGAGDPGDPQQQALQQLDELSLALARATDLRSLKSLNDQAAVVKDMLRRMGEAFEMQNRFAEMELRSARKLGQVLAAQVRRGRPQKRSRGDTISEPAAGHLLPDWISKSKSSRCQRIAGIGKERFEEYIGRAREHCRLISQAGLLRTCDAGSRRRPRRAGVRIVPDERLDPVWDAVHATMDVSVAVGVGAALVGATEELRADLVRRQKLCGNVLVHAEEREDEWLTVLHEARQSCQVSQAIIVFRATTREAWFRLLDEQGWTCCFLSGESGTATTATVVAYTGERRRGFEVAFSGLGALLQGARMRGG